MRLPDNSLPIDRPLYTRELQEFLRKLAFYHEDIPLVVPDGIFGPETGIAVAAFQRLFGLPVTGQVNADTWKRLVIEYRRIVAMEALPIPLGFFDGNDTVLRFGDTGDTVLALQIMLSALARRFASLDAVALTGVLDDDTTAAVKVLQQRGNLLPTGQVNKDTWDYIAALYNAAQKDL